VVCPPDIDLAAALESAKGSNVAIGGRTCTGKGRRLHGRNIGGMLLALGVTHVIIGHSERRQYFGETDDTVNLRLKAALEAGLTPDLLRGRSSGRTRGRADRRRAPPPVCASLPCHLRKESRQTGRRLRAGLGHWHRQNRDARTRRRAHAVIRREATEIFGEDFATKLRILYGGSVKPDNASALMAQEEIDGALVGGASLDPKSFAAIVKY
jgi:triosephosphate isomerase (TIM)